jgi:diguanylate cyclase (GGDEF)-like protein
MILNFGFSKKMNILCHLLALLVLTSYAIHHILNEILIIGTLLFISAAFLAHSLILVLNDHNSIQALRRFSLIMALSLFATCYYLGIRGIIFVFPLITSYFYCFPYQKAIVWSCLSSIFALLALLNMVEPIIVGRFFIALSISLFFNISIANLIYRQKRLLTKEAREDQLTGISNRRHFNEILTKALLAAKTSNNTIALLFIDLDNFKEVNDVYGHSIGDFVLKETSIRLQSNIREYDTIYRVDESEHIARLGGDEFAAIIRGSSSVDEIINVVERLLNKISQPYKTGGITLNCHASIGVAFNDDNTDSAKALIKKADSAMYQAKRNGKKRYQFFNQKIFEMMAEEQDIKRYLQEALVNNLFYFNFMPIFNAKTMRIDAVEVLLRVNSQELSHFGTERFISVAEGCDLIYEIDLWVVENAFIKNKEYCSNYKNTSLFF